MLSIFRKKKKQEEQTPAPKPAPVEGEASSEITWSEDAKQALEQTLAQAPMPKLLKPRIKKELTKAAEAYARKSGRTEVSAHDLMQGFMSKLPAEMRNQVEQAARKGPEGLKMLQKKLEKQQKK